METNQINYREMPGRHVKTYSFPDANCVIVSGDIHGDFNLLVYKLCVQYAMTNTLLIVAGDCGFGFEKKEYYENVYRRIQKRLKEANDWIVLVRGNHDNPAYFEQEMIKHERFMTVPDYSIIKTCGHSLLCVGGAISIDRTNRIRIDTERSNPYGFKTKTIDSVACYWPEETVYYNERLLSEVKAIGIIDTVITHTAPSFCELIEKDGLIGWAHYDFSLYEDCTRERNTLDALFHKLIEDGHPLTHWYYGHFHQSWHGSVDGVLFKMLDIMEFTEVR